MVEFMAEDEDPRVWRNGADGDRVNEIGGIDEATGDPDERAGLESPHYLVAGDAGGPPRRLCTMPEFVAKLKTLGAQRKHLDSPIFSERNWEGLSLNSGRIRAGMISA